MAMSQRRRMTGLVHVSRACATLIALVVAGLTVSCAHAPGGSAPGATAATEAPVTTAVAISLPGTSWRAEDIDGSVALPGADATMVFAEGTVSGNTSCSDYTGLSTIQDGGRLTFTTMSTRYGTCSPEITDQERRFLKAMQYVKAYTADSDGKLHLLDSYGKERMRLARR